MLSALRISGTLGFLTIGTEFLLGMVTLFLNDRLNQDSRCVQGLPGYPTAFAGRSVGLSVRSEVTSC